MNIIEHTFDFGDELQDSVTGYKGIVMGITKYATDCLHYGLCEQSLKDGKPQDWQWFDETRCVLVKAGAVKLKKPEKPTSGPYPNAPTK